MEAERNEGGIRETATFALIFVLSAAATVFSVFVVFMPHGVGDWYYDRDAIFVAFVASLIPVAVTLALHLLLARRILTLVSAPPMLGLAFAETWWILGDLDILPPHGMFSYLNGIFLFSPLFVILLGIAGQFYASAGIVERKDFRLTKKWFSILPFTCSVGLSAAAFFWYVKYPHMQGSSLALPAAVLFGTVAGVVLIIFALGRRGPVIPRAVKTLSLLFAASLAATFLIAAFLAFVFELILLAFVWLETMFILQFAIAAANMDWLVHQPLGKTSVKVALGEGFLGLLLWLLLAVIVFQGVFSYTIF